MTTIPRTSGIYQWLCVPTGKVYVGSAINLKKRYNHHVSALRLGTHANLHLQRAWVKYGESSFLFTVIEHVRPDSLLEREQYWIDVSCATSPTNGFNIAPVAGSVLGIKRTPEQRTQMSITARKRMASIERRSLISRIHKGKTITDEHRARIGAGNLRHIDEIMARLPDMTEKCKKNYIATDPDGNEYVVHGLCAFCRERQLDGSVMSAIANGKRKQHKGWTCRHHE